MKRRATSEAVIQRAVCAQLHALGRPGLVWWHTNNNPRSAKDGARLRRLGLTAGVSDLFLVHNGRCFALELKSERGRLSKDQRAFLAAINSAGGHAREAHGIDEALQALTDWGVIR